MAEDNWDEDFEPPGITLGPEKRLEREIAKSKTLKVERLQLRDRIARLEEKVDRLEQENSDLRNGLTPTSADPQWQSMTDPAGSPGFWSNCWVLGGLVVLFISAAVLWFRGVFG